jgi:MFS family permease
MPQNMPTLTLNADSVPPVVLVLLGIVVLLFGRSLYWAFIAIAGFLVGMALANEWLADKQEWIRILAAVGAGLIGAIVGILVQRLAFAIGGFFAGGYLALALATRWRFGGDPHILMIVGGVIGAIAAAMIMDWAIIVLSSLAGAAAILAPFQAKLDDKMLPIAFLVLAVIGIVFQGRRMTGLPPTTTPPATTQPPV